MNKQFDISEWGDGKEELCKYEDRKDPKPHKISSRFSPLNIDSKPLYALLVHFISRKPNGFYTFLQGISKPLDNFIWWDFILSCEDKVIHVWRTNLILEAQFCSNSEEIPVEDFFNKNIERHQEEINKTLASFEKHSVYINHFKSYSKCIEYLWDNINKIDLTVPEIPDTHLVKDKSSMNEQGKLLSGYLKASIKFHALGKSLILNSAFMVEAYINTLIRFGLNPILNEYNSVTKMYLKSNFEERLKALPLFCIIFKDKIDITRREVTDVLRLMELRNKYVHADETSRHNKVGEIIFDGDFPVFGDNDLPWGMLEIKKAFLVPSPNLVKWAYECSFSFLHYIESLIADELRSQVLLFMNQDRFGFNEKSKKYSVISNDYILNFYMQGGKGES